MFVIFYMMAQTSQVRSRCWAGLPRRHAFGSWLSCANRRVSRALQRVKYRWHYTLMACVHKPVPSSTKHHPCSLRRESSPLASTAPKTTLTFAVLGHYTRVACASLVTCLIGSLPVIASWAIFFLPLIMCIWLAPHAHPCIRFTHVRSWVWTQPRIGRAQHSQTQANVVCKAFKLDRVTLPCFTASKDVTP